MISNDPPDLTIIGAGLSGISAAYHFHGKSEIYEKDDKIGGTASTELVNGFYFDHGPHVSFTHDKYIRELLERRTPVYTRVARPMNTRKGVEFAHPALFHLRSLPKLERYKILSDLIMALKNYDENKKPANYQEWCDRNQGKYFSRNYTYSYTTKFWQAEPAELTCDWIGERVPIPSIEFALKGALGLSDISGYYFQDFRYPKTGGFGSFADFWQDKKENISIHLNKTLTRIDAVERLLSFSDGSTAEYKKLISTIPLPELLKLLPNVPEKIRIMGSKLRSTSLHYVNLALNGVWNRKFTWLYIYDDDVPVSRLIPYNALSKAMSPSGTTSMQLEIPYEGIFDQSLVSKAISAVEALGYLKSGNIISYSEYDLKYGYVKYDKNRNESVNFILEWLSKMGIISIGRYGSWAYMWSHQVIEQGRNAVLRITEKSAGEQR